LRFPDSSSPQHLPKILGAPHGQGDIASVFAMFIYSCPLVMYAVAGQNGLRVDAGGMATGFAQGTRISETLSKAQKLCEKQYSVPFFCRISILA
jgi:hypothetical protein